MGERHVFSEKSADMVLDCGDQAGFSVAKWLMYVHGGSGGAVSDACWKKGERAHQAATARSEWRDEVPPNEPNCSPPTARSPTRKLPVSALVIKEPLLNGHSAP